MDDGGATTANAGQRRNPPRQARNDSEGEEAEVERAGARGRSPVPISCTARHLALRLSDVDMRGAALPDRIAQRRWLPGRAAGSELASSGGPYHLEQIDELVHRFTVAQRLPAKPGARAACGRPRPGRMPDAYSCTLMKPMTNSGDPPVMLDRAANLQ